MPTAVRSLLAAVVVTVVSVVAGLVLVGPAQRPSAPPPPEPALALADLDTTTMAIVRAGFCARLTPAQVTAALDGEAADTASYDNGDRVALSGAVSDVAHEYGCAWTGADGTRARAWVFAPPVTPDRAARLARAAARVEGCSRLPGAASYGASSLAVACPVEGGREVSFRGLFGDAWLTCTLSAPAVVPRAALVERADRWCAAVAVAAAPDDAEPAAG